MPRFRVNSGPKEIKGVIVFERSAFVVHQLVLSSGIFGHLLEDLALNQKDSRAQLRELDGLSNLKLRVLVRVDDWATRTMTQDFGIGNAFLHSFHDLFPVKRSEERRVGKE